MSSDIKLLYDFITPQEEQEFKTELFDKYADKCCKDRIAIRFGSLLPCNCGIVEREIIPEVVERLRNKLVSKGIIDFPDSITCNMYPPGTIINPHIDDVKMCGPLVVILSLFADTTITFRDTKMMHTLRNPSLAEKEEIYFPARTLFILGGDKRYTWTHETKATTTFRASIVFKSKKQTD